MANNPETYLDKFLYKAVSDSNNDVFPARPTLRLLGATITDNPSNLSTDVTGIGGLSFDPVNLMKAVAAGATSSGDAPTATGANDTGASTFLIYDTSVAHQCLGVRFLWVGAATNVKCSLWKYTSNSAGSRLASVVQAVTLAVSATPGDYSALFSSPIALTPGVFYGASVWDESGTSLTTMGTVGASGTSILGALLTTGVEDAGSGASGLSSSQAIVASGFHMYAVVHGSGGGFATSPFSIFGSGDVLPRNISSAFIPVSPILQ